ncbi:transcriptional regulator [Carbonactinospora thermoautotrophica]|uniref:transcriptional regulator n=1 Tax=Carbonactinospora thermoautotrophica TaxID=1469144 RepID=UPI00226E3982|nr:transcriptional regulator [Carbonactinospora thermoautotrophica]MCX9191999.1 transcriptional regulator [Carbonactinospora thermoautotrophica]
MTDSAVVFTVAFAALYAAHAVADHWVQTDHQARRKGLPGWPGRIACARHVATYTLTGAVFLLAGAFVTGLHLSPAGVAAGLTVNAASHYIADRRTPLRRLAELVGKGPFWQLGAPRPGRDDNPNLGTGAYALDQSWHIGWLFITALLIA